MLRPRVPIAIVAVLLAGALPAQTPRFRAESNVVLVPVLVEDGKGNPVYGLSADDFVLEDDRVPQTVHLDQATESEPVAVVIAVETGGRAMREFSRMRGIGAFSDLVLQQSNAEVAVVEFDSKPRLASGFTTDSDMIRKVMDNLQPGDQGVAILDAVSYSIKLLERVASKQRVLLLVSETRDHSSRHTKVSDVVTAIGNSNTVVYALHFSPLLSQVLDTERGSNRDEWRLTPDLNAAAVALGQAMRRNVTKTVASMTGGEYELFSTRVQFETLMTAFTNHLHSRYLLSFQPKEPHPGLHRLDVRLRDPHEQRVLARTSYWALGK